jgi:hypothetical protein
MARYSAFLGLQVEVQYRAGDILLPASGTFVGDTGRSVFLEQSFEQRGQRRNFRWEIPNQYIVRLAEKAAVATASTSAAKEPSSAREPGSTDTAPGTSSPADAELVEPAGDPLESEEPEKARAAAAGYNSRAALIYPRAVRSNS